MHAGAGLRVADAPTSPIRVFRILKGDKAVRDDFLSDGARGKRPRDTSAEAMAHHRGFSVWRTLEQARGVARRFPVLGTHIAEIALPIGASLLPFRDTPDHQTALGDPDASFGGSSAFCLSTRLPCEKTEMTYELWDLESGNAQGVYASLLAALQVAHDAVERDGIGTLDGLALFEVRPGGDRRMLAKERDLVPLIGVHPASVR